MSKIQLMIDILKIKKAMLLAGDIIFLVLSLPVTLLISFGQEFNAQIFAEHFLPFLFLYLFILVLFYISGLYDIRKFKSTTSIFATLFVIHVVATILGIVFFYFATDFLSITPKTNLVLNMTIATIFVWMWRALFQRFLAQHLKINVAIAGISEHAKELASIMNMKPYLGYQLTAIIGIDSVLEQQGVQGLGDGTKLFFADKDLIRNLQKSNIDTVITAENPHLNPRIAQAFYECIPYKINFLDLAQSYEILTGRIPISYINQTWFLENINEQQKKLYGNIKRPMDIILASLILILILPLWPLIALAIKWESSGPIFYSQERVGSNKKLFRLTKFRSMVDNAENDKAIWAQKKDPRITRVGTFLRRTHLDELPQMLNIIKGDISLVGPRPERIEFVKELEKQIPHYNIRHIIKPGFTGWAQVNFRYARTSMDTYEKFQYDLYYLKNRSIVLDIAITLKTLRLFFKDE